MRGRARSLLKKDIFQKYSFQKKMMGITGVRGRARSLLQKDIFQKYSFQKNDGGSQVCVVEPDPSYSTSATTLSVGGLRSSLRQHFNPELNQKTSTIYEPLKIKKSPQATVFPEGEYKDWLVCQVTVTVVTAVVVNDLAAFHVNLYRICVSRLIFHI